MFVSTKIATKVVTKMTTALENPRQALRKKMRSCRGSISRLCMKSGFSRQYVYMVLREERQNDDLWLLAIEVLTEMEKEKESLNQKIVSGLMALSI